MSVRNLGTIVSVFITGFALSIAIPSALEAQTSCKSCVQGSTAGCAACDANPSGSWYYCNPDCVAGGGCWVSGQCLVTLHDAVISPVGRLVAEAVVASAGSASAAAPAIESAFMFAAGSVFGVTSEARSCGGLLIARAYSEEETAQIRASTRVIRI